MLQLTFVYLFFLLHCYQNLAFSQPECTQSPGEPVRTLRLLTMLPYPNPVPQFNPSWDEGYKVFPALTLARDQINNRTDLLPCHRLELLSMDGGCDITSTTAVGATIGLIGEEAEATVLEAEAAVLGVIGPGCSRSALQTATLLNRSSIQLVQVHGGGSPLLKDRTIYTTSLGILGSAQAFVDLSLALMRKSSWQNIAILFESNRLYYRTTKETFVSSLSSDVNVLFVSPVYTTFYPLDGVRHSLARIVFIFTASSHALRIMCLAYHMGMVYPAYQWVMISHRLSEFVPENATLSENVTFTYSQRSYTCSYGNLLNIAMEGTFMLNYQLISSSPSSSQKFANTTFDNFVQLYDEYASSDNVSTTYWAYYFYDALWAWAKVLHSVTTSNAAVFDNFQYGNASLANMILDKFYAEDFEFEGMSGLIRFNRSTGFHARPSNLYQVINGEELHVAFNNGTTIVKLRTLVTIPDLVRSVGGVHVALIVVFGTVQFVEYFAIIVLHILTVVYRKERTVRASSPTLAHFAFAGVYVFLFGQMLNLFVEVRPNSAEVRGNVCQAVWAWIFPIGFTLSIGTVTVRTWRLYRIFTHYMDPGKLISNTALICILLVLLCIDLIIAIVWTAVDPLRLVTVETNVRVGSTNELVLEQSCRSRFGWAGYASWLIIVMTIRVAVLMVMVTLSVLTRRIPNRTFATTSLRVFSYTFSSVYLIGLALYYFSLYLNLDDSIQYAILFTTLNMLTILYIACVFLPPLMPVVHSKWKENHDKSSSTGWHTTTKNHATMETELHKERIRKTSTDRLL